MTSIDAINIVKNIKQYLKSQRADKGIAVFKIFQKVIKNYNDFCTTRMI